MIITAAKVTALNAAKAAAARTGPIFCRRIGLRSRARA